MFASLEDSVAKAAALVRAPRKTRTVPLPEAGGEVLASDIAADRNIPPFPRAAMDGSVRFTDKARPGQHIAPEVEVVPQCIAECRVEKVLHKVAVKPGKPLCVGRGPSGTVVFGLPGNPVAVMVHMAMLVKPLFLKASGAREYLPKPIYLPLAGKAHNRSIGKKFTLARVVSKGGSYGNANRSGRHSPEEHSTGEGDDRSRQARSDSGTC